MRSQIILQSSRMIQQVVLISLKKHGDLKKSTGKNKGKLRKIILPDFRSREARDDIQRNFPSRDSSYLLQ